MSRIPREEQALLDISINEGLRAVARSMQEALALIEAHLAVMAEDPSINGPVLPGDVVQDRAGLTSLPIGSVVLDGAGESCQKTRTGWSSWVEFPATILHAPHGRPSS